MLGHKPKVLMHLFKQLHVNFFRRPSQSICETELTFLEAPAVEGTSTLFC